MLVHIFLTYKIYVGMMPVLIKNVWATSWIDGNTALDAKMARHLGVCHIWIVTCPNGSAESYANPSVSALTTCPLSLRLCAKGDVYPLTAELTLAGNRHFCPVILDLSCCAREGAKRKQMKKPCNKAIVCSGSVMRALKQKYFFPPSEQYAHGLALALKQFDY